MHRRPRPEAATPQPCLRLGPERAAGTGFDLAQGLLTRSLGQGQAADPCGFRAGDERRGQAQQGGEFPDPGVFSGTGIVAAF